MSGDPYRFNDHIELLAAAVCPTILDDYSRAAHLRQLMISHRGEDASQISTGPAARLRVLGGTSAVAFALARAEGQPELAAKAALFQLLEGAYRPATHCPFEESLGYEVQERMWFQSLVRELNKCQFRLDHPYKPVLDPLILYRNVDPWFYTRWLCGQRGNPTEGMNILQHLCQMHFDARGLGLLPFLAHNLCGCGCDDLSSANWYKTCVCAATIVAAGEAFIHLSVDEIQVRLCYDRSMPHHHLIEQAVEFIWELWPRPIPSPTD
jgi:hypothetical protein